MNLPEGFKFVEDTTAPKGRRIVRVSDAVVSDAPAVDEPVSAVIPTDAEMRDAIEAATGKRPGGRTSHENLVKQFEAL